MMLRIECDQNFSIAGSDGSVGTIRLIDPRIRQSNIVQDRLQFLLRNFLPQNILNFVAKPRRLFHAQARASANMQAQLPGVHLREEVSPEEHKQSERKKTKGQKAKHKHTAMIQRGFQQSLVS